MTVTKRTRFERVTTFALLAAGLSVAVIGLLALLGWVLDEPILTLWKAGTLPMAPSTTVLSVLFGAALCLSARMPQGRVALLLTTLIGVAGTVTTLLLFALRLLGVHWSAELLGLRITGMFGDAPIGYITPITAFCFLLSYGSLLVSLPHYARISWRGWVLWGSGGLISLVSFALLLAYAFGVPLLYGKALIPSALNSSLILLIMGLAQLVLATRNTGRLAAPSDAGALRLLPYALVFLAFAAGTVAVAYYSYRSNELRFRQEVESQLLTVSELKTDELVRWRKERFWDATLSQNTAIAAAVRRLLETPHSVSAQREMQDLLGKYQRSIGYDRAFLLDAKGVTRMSVPGTEEPTAAIIAERAAVSLRMGQVILQDFYRDEHDQRVYLALMVPILDQQHGNRPLGVVMLRIDPGIYLYPQIMRWPAPSTSAKTLLVRREGNDVLFLNDLRFHANAALTLRFPLTGNAELPAAKAVTGQSGIVDGVDYRGVPTIAAVRAVPDSPWYIVTRLDKEELYAPLRERMWLTLLLVSILVCSMGAVVIFLWRQQRLAFYRRQHELTSALRINEERHRSILSSAMDGFCLIDMQGRLLEVNETYCRMSGYSEQELLTMRIADLEAAETSEDVATHLQYIMAQGEDRFESRHRRKDGSIFEVEVSIQYQSTEGGRYVIFLQDITERKQAEEKAKESEKKFKSMTDTSPLAIYISSGIEQKAEYINPTFINLFGYTLDEVPSVSQWWPLAYPDEKYRNQIVEEWQRKVEQAIETNLPIDPMEVMVTCKDGSKKNILWGYIATGVQSWAFGLDITERKQAEDKIRESEKKFKSMTNTSPLAIYMSSGMEQKAEYINPTFTKLFGYTLADVPTASHWWPLAYPDDTYRAQVQAEWERKVEQAIKTNSGIEPMETVVTCKDGSKKNISWGFISSDVQDWSFGLDLTERKQAEEALQKSEEAYRMLFESSRDAIMTLNAEGNLLSGNLAAIALFGCRDEQEFITLSIATTSPEFQPDGRRSDEKAQEIIGLVLDKGLHFFEWTHRQVDGTEFFANVLLTRMEVAGKKLLQATVRDITERKRVEDVLKESERVKSELLDKLNKAQHLAMIGSWEWDLQTNDVWWSDETYRIFCVTQQDYIPSFEANRKFIHPDDVATYDKSFEHCFQTGEPLDLNLRLVANDGVLKYCQAKAGIIYDDSGQQIRFIGTIMDITERKQAEEQLRLAASVFTHAGEGIMITAADGTIIDVNGAFSRITSYSRDEVLGKNPHFLSSGRQGKDFYAALWCDLVEKGLWYGEVWNRRKNGEVYAVMQTISAVHDDQSNTRHYVALFSDITLLKEHEKELEHIAHYDALTSLPNRTLLDDRLRQGMVQAQRHTHPLALAFLDLDGFKAINDKHGHEAGDQLLIAVADRMKQALRKGDTLARLGGDEFVVVLLDLADVATSVPMLTRLLAAAAEPVQFGDITLQVSASLGVSFYPQAEDIDADQLLRQADQSMYLAKQAGKNRYHFFDAEQDRIIRDHHESLERIRHALTAGEFVLYYQPKVNMRTGTIIGAEALIRWQHPEKGLLLPTVFLPVIEDHPLAVDIGEWVIDTALAQMDIWQAAGLNIPVSVNVGACQLQQMNFVERLHEMLVAHPTVRQGDLELEVLETSAMEDLTKISGVIDASRKIGVSFALDDFGTGYSSLTYLKRLPVSILKIDQSFVRVMLDNLDDLSIVEGVLGLATAFHLQVIAEGVETIEHGTLLLQLGCDLAQGYGIARPMPAHQLPAWATTWQPDLVWAESPSFSHADLPLLFASVEHRAWIVAMEKYLKGEREVPLLLDIHQCRFSQWLNTEGLVRFGAQPSFKAIEILHQQMHALAAELCELQAQGRNPEALARLGELHDLRDAFLEQLTLPQQSRQQVVKEV